MTICPGGLTQAKSGIAAFVNYGSSAAGLLSLVPRLAALAPAAYVLSGVSIATSVLCGSEPPAMPTFTQAEINDLINNNFFDTNYATALGKLKDMISNLAWYQLCECQSGGAVTLPTPPVQPTPPVVSPTNIPNTTFECSVSGPTTQVWNASFSGTSGRFIQNFSSLTNPVSAHFTLTVAPHTGGTGQSTHWTVFKTAGGGSEVDIESFNLPAAATTYDRVFPYDPAFPGLEIRGDLDAFTNPGEDVTFLTHTFCTGQPTLGPANCCPPDPLVVAKLESIQALVTLLQRQLAPFAYVNGAVHTGLSGTGVLSVQGLLGARIVITTDPTTLGVEGTSPPILFDRGYITWGTADGYPQSERLERTSQLSLPARASAFTDLAYDLHPGVVVTITELVREP